MLATLVLKRHHRRVRELFSQIRRVSPSDLRSKADLFAELKKALRTQLTVEAEVLYPALSLRPSPEAGTVFEQFLQHQFEIDDILARLAGLGTQDPGFQAGLVKLEEKVETYLREVQHGPYGEARKRLSRKRLEELGELIQARMEIVMRPVFGE